MQCIKINTYVIYLYNDTITCTITVMSIYKRNNVFNVLPSVLNDAMWINIEILRLFHSLTLILNALIIIYRCSGRDDTDGINHKIILNFNTPLFSCCVSCHSSHSAVLVVLRQFEQLGGKHHFFTGARLRRCDELNSTAPRPVRCVNFRQIHFY